MSTNYDQTVSVEYTPNPNNNPSYPGTWKFNPDPVKVANNAPSPVQVTYKFAQPNGWKFFMLSIRLLQHGGEKYDNPYVSLTKTNPTGNSTQYNLDNSGASFTVALSKFADTQIVLEFNNWNYSSDDVFLGVTVSVTDGTYTQTSYDPQIKLPKQD